MNETTEKKKPVIQSLQVGMSILQVVNDYRRPMKFSEILEETGITKSNLYKYLNTLIELGMLYKSYHTGRYSLGPKMVEFGMNATNNDNVIEQITPYLEEIKVEFNETVIFSKWTVGGPMILKIVHGSHIFNIGAEIGSLMPVYSATGKVFGAFASGEIETWTKKQLEELEEEKALTLEKEFEMIRNEKISFAEEAIAPSISSLAIPILNFENNIIGTITVVGFKERMRELSRKQLAEQILIKRKIISRIFGEK
ncbi:IclR family transcriptional regulator [Alkalicoccus saliphilus]|uniref:IclR family transcriptional regulator n=1 Tax=Alkalicoccus saliphilus TaxID=200989 RepID=A0A2T4U3X5_9BACI|nr:helix-turn-helix domain-containing protein [Alkalicoccus saliphilus]PTL38089.1 IclR family transcriptional regulator [Alkalicoccus saliphilus]